MGKVKDIFTSWKVILLILFLIASAVAINPKLHTEGVVVTSVVTNSSAEINGVTTGLKISAMNGQSVADVNDFRALESSLLPGTTIKIETDKGEFSFLPETINNTIISIGFGVDSIPKSNIKQGLDLVGGVRVLLKPESQLTMQQFTDVMAITQKRLNAFGLQDISVKSVSDLSGNSYVLVEMAGATEQQAAKLIAQQGKFEAKIGNDTIFVGGTDIKQVCRAADCSGIRDCNQDKDGSWVCSFQFRVDVSPESAKRHADLTRNMSVVTVGSNVYLEKKLDLYLDNELVESLYISEGLRGIESTSFVIEGPGGGATKEAAISNALTNMKAMQTVLITGALPVKLESVKMDIISPALGEQFLKYAIIAVIGAIAAVGVVIFARYKRPLIAGMVFLTGLSEVVIILGIAALIKWNLDLAGIAGLIAAVGTGVDAQIIITDEFLSGLSQAIGGWKERAKRAFFIIFGSFATVVAAMIPLYILGATLLKGFAIITIIGVSIGVFVTRPAYAKILEILLK